MTKEKCVNGCWWLRMCSGVMIISIAMVSWPKTMASTATRAGRSGRSCASGRPARSAGRGGLLRRPTDLAGQLGRFGAQPEEDQCGAEAEEQQRRSVGTGQFVHPRACRQVGHGAGEQRAGEGAGPPAPDHHAGGADGEPRTPALPAGPPPAAPTVVATIAVPRRPQGSITWPQMKAEKAEP